MRLSADLDEGVVRALGLKAHPTGFSIEHVLKDATLVEDETGQHYADPTIVALEVTPDVALAADGRPTGYDAMLSELRTPASVTSAQAKIQLRRTPGVKAQTLREDVEAVVAEADGETQDWYAEARTWERQNPYVLGLSAGLGLKPADVDALFIAAARIAA